MLLLQKPAEQLRLILSSKDCVVIQPGTLGRTESKEVKGVVAGLSLSAQSYIKFKDFSGFCEVPGEIQGLRSDIF